MEYACHVWHTILTVNESEILESTQNRAIRIIEQDLSYQEVINITGLEPLQSRRQMSRDFFLKIVSPKHKLIGLSLNLGISVMVSEGPTSTRYQCTAHGRPAGHL